MTVASSLFSLFTDDDYRRVVDGGKGRGSTRVILTVAGADSMLVGAEEWREMRNK